MRSTCNVPSFNFFLGAISDTEVQIFSVFLTWLPQHVTCDVIIAIKIFYMSCCIDDDKFVSIRQAVTEKNTKVLCGQKTDRQTERQTNKPKYNILSFGEGKCGIVKTLTENNVP